MDNNQRSDLTQPVTYSLLHAGGWSCFIAISLMVSISVHRQEIITIAHNVARAHIEKDILYRKWNALKGGVYVSTDKETVPNPYLPSFIRERDVKTPSGRLLTLVNPAYMTRQIYELAQKEQKISGHITSLKPLRPENRPDAWEESALKQFNSGIQEVSTVTTEGGSRYFRLICPLVTEESCLECHSHQGYRKGDVRGGISVSLPMTLFESATKREMTFIWLGHGIMWLLGLTGLYIGYSGLRRRTEERDHAEDELRRVNAILESQATTDSLTGIFNRRKFLELTQIAILEAKRYGMPLALILFDIDYFKRVNDVFGHEAGDGVLQGLAGIVSGMIRQTDIFGRLGGEEFVILLHNNDIISGCDVAEKIRSRLNQHNFVPAGNVSCSFGVTGFHPDDTLETFMKRADEAMYAAKQGGRNRVEMGHAHLKTEGRNGEQCS